MSDDKRELGITHMYLPEQGRVVYEGSGHGDMRKWVLLECDEDGRAGTLEPVMVDSLRNAAALLRELGENGANPGYTQISQYVARAGAATERILKEAQGHE